MTVDLWNAAKAVVDREPGRKYPCCTLTGHVLLLMAGLPELVGSAWWKAANVWDPARPYSAVTSAFDLVGGPGSSPGEYPLLTDDGRRLIADILSDDAGSWYIVQGWRRLLPNGHADPGDLGSGHTFLMHIIGNSRCQVLESSVERGVRFNGQPWYGAGKPEDHGDESIVERFARYPAGIGLVRVEQGMPITAVEPALVSSVMSSTTHTESEDEMFGISLNLIEGLLELLQSMQDGELSREEFVAAGDKLIETGLLEGAEEAAWGEIYDLAAPMVAKIKLPKIDLSRRTVEELLADAAEAEDAGKPKKAQRLRDRAAKRAE